MPPQAYALVTLFLAGSILVGILATWLVARRGGPRRRPAHVLPVGAAFLAFYLVGHRLGIAVGPEVELFGFQVALLGDLAIGFGCALVVALGQALVVRLVRAGRQGRPGRAGDVPA